MKLLKKTISSSGRVHIYFFGIKIASYQSRDFRDIKGNGNVVSIPKTHKCVVHIRGNNNRVVIEEVPSNWSSNLIIYIGFEGSECNNCDIHIGKGTSFEQASIVVCEDNTIVEIGDDCMFSFLEQIWASDTHTIINDKKEIVNIGKYIKIGNHVWVGADVSILKNTVIADNCIIGTKACVGGCFTESGCVIAGNPAQVVKKNINWTRQRPNEYIAGLKK